MRKILFDASEVIVIEMTSVAKAVAKKSPSNANVTRNTRSSHTASSRSIENDSVFY